MAVSPMDARLETAQARIHVYSYRYERPSHHVRSPGQDVLALFADRAADAACILHTAHATTPLIRLGGLMIVPEGATISAIGAGGMRRLAVCTMARGILPGAFDASDQRHLTMCSDVRDVNVRAGMQRLAHEAASPGFASDVLVDSLARAIQVDLARYFAVVPTGRDSSGTLAPWQLRRIEEYLQASEGERIRIARLADAAEISVGHLTRSFKRTTGRTVHQFVEEARLTRAKTLLVETALPLKQIASRLGFATPSSFSLAFRRATGITPGLYRMEGTALN